MRTPPGAAVREVQRTSSVHPLFPREVVVKRAAVARLLDEAGLRYLPGEGTFSLFVSIQGSRLGSEEFCDRLLEEGGVSTVPGIGYGHSCDHLIRLSVGSESMERIRRGVERIAGLLRETVAEPQAALDERSGSGPAGDGASPGRLTP